MGSIEGFSRGRDAVDSMGAAARNLHIAGGLLWPAAGDGGCLAADDVAAVVVLWGVDEQLPWIGWLTTSERRSIAFSPRDMEDEQFQIWLGDLRDWMPGKLTRAATEPGMHEVWRSPDLLATGGV